VRYSVWNFMLYIYHGEAVAWRKSFPRHIFQVKLIRVERTLLSAVVDVDVGFAISALAPPDWAMDVSLPIGGKVSWPEFRPSTAAEATSRKAREVAHPQIDSVGRSGKHPRYTPVVDVARPL